MANDLSLKAKRLLSSQYGKLMLDENSVANTSGALAEVISWCADLEFKPGKWLKPSKTYRFDRECIERIEQILIEEKHASLFDVFYHDDHQSAALRNPYEKQGNIKPTYHLLLAAVTDARILEFVEQSFHSSQQINLELDNRTLKLENFGCLLVIENRDSFNDWFKYQQYGTLSKPLVVYRGDKYHSTACKSLLKNWLNTQGGKDVIYFGDFDLAGLRIALSGGYSHLLLPELKYIAEQALTQHYPDEQLKYLPRLERECPQAMQTLFLFMSTNRVGLRQQKMYQTPLILHPTA